MPLLSEDDKTLEQFLTELKSSGSLSPYNLTLYCGRREERAESPRFRSCCMLVQDQLCRDASRQFFEEELEALCAAESPAACRYGGGFLGFVVPFTKGELDFCLVGDGVREKTIDLWQLAVFSRRWGSEPQQLFRCIESVPAATLEEVDQLARELGGRVTAWLSSEAAAAQAPPPDGDETLLAAVADTLERLEGTATMVEAIALCCETVAAHFQVAGMAVGLYEKSGACYHVSGIWGLPEQLGSVCADAIDPFLSGERARKKVPCDDRIASLLPALEGGVCAFFPLWRRGERLGFIALTGTGLAETELLLVSMVANATATTMSRLLRDQEQSEAAALTGKLMSLANTLLQADTKEELYESILAIACDLIGATQGSVMLIDGNGKSMRIVFTRGMSLNVARSIPIKVGRGMAGQVAQSGIPLLVSDVERDARVAMPNRPRFKSKSLICIPLKLKEKVIGVLNLSDKKSLAPFSDADLRLLSSFADLASVMIERTLVLEQSVRFEQLSVTDSLTGLYNRRFLKSRLEEELNRSVRQGLNLTVVFIDLDYFKSYNDLCGHIAGDQALKKAAELIKGSLREMDIVARYGGEEFCAVLPGTPKDEGMTVAERIRAEIERERFPGESDIPPRRITASLGVASYPEDGGSYTELVHASDVALYRAKAEGRNRVVAAQGSRPETGPPPQARPGPEENHPLPDPPDPPPSPGVAALPQGEGAAKMRSLEPKG